MSSGELRVLVQRATDLKDTDKVAGASDPFVVLKCGGGVAVQTRVISGTLNPVWNEELRVSVPLAGDGRAQAPLYVEVFDKDTVGKDILGKSEVDLSTLARGQPRDAVVPLLGNGRLFLQLTAANFGAAGGFGSGSPNRPYGSASGSSYGSAGGAPRRPLGSGPPTYHGSRSALTPPPPGRLAPQSIPSFGRYQPGQPTEPYGQSLRPSLSRLDSTPTPTPSVIGQAPRAIGPYQHGPGVPPVPVAGGTQYGPGAAMQPYTQSGPVGMYGMPPPATDAVGAASAVASAAVRVADGVGMQTARTPASTFAPTPQAQQTVTRYGGMPPAPASVAATLIGAAPAGTMGHQNGVPYVNGTQSPAGAMMVPMVPGAGMPMGQMVMGPNGQMMLVPFNPQQMQMVPGQPQPELDEGLSGDDEDEELLSQLREQQRQLEAQKKAMDDLLREREMVKARKAGERAKIQAERQAISRRLVELDMEERKLAAPLPPHLRAQIRSSSPGNHGGSPPRAPPAHYRSPQRSEPGNGRYYENGNSNGTGYAPDYADRAPERTYHRSQPRYGHSTGSSGHGSHGRGGSGYSRSHSREQPPRADPVSSRYHSSSSGSLGSRNHSHGRRSESPLARVSGASGRRSGSPLGLSRYRSGSAGGGYGGYGYASRSPSPTGSEPIEEEEEYYTAVRYR